MSRAILLILLMSTVAAAQERPPVKCVENSPERRGQEGCTVLANRPLVGSLPTSVFWHIDRFDSLEAAKKAAGPNGVAAEAHGSFWLMTVEAKSEDHLGGHHIAWIGPLALPAADSYSMRVQSSLLMPGARTPAHTHPGPEVIYIVDGEQCMETPEVGHRLGPGQSYVVPGDVVHRGRPIGSKARRALALNLYDAAHPVSHDLSDSSPPVVACSRRAEVEVIRRDQLGVSSIDNGRTRVLWTSSMVEAGKVGYRDLSPLITVAYDEVPPGSGFKLHAHDNAEIITIVLEGSLDHEDTAGHRGRVKAGEVALMSAGSGVKHSEFGNPDMQTRSVTIWLKPRTMNKPPSHMTAKPVEQDGWQLIAGERAAPLIVEQDARILMKRLTAHKRVRVVARPGRLVYLAVVEGEVVTDGQRLSVPERILLRDGEISVASDAGATVVVVDVPWTKK